MSDYKFLVKYIDRKEHEHIKTIVEFGSRDGLDAIYLAENFKNAKVYTLECNPRQIEVCQNNIKNSTFKDRIVFINACVSDKKEKKRFYHYPENVGASSLYIHQDKRNENDYSYIETVTAEEVLSEFGVKDIDLLCMDIQGHELQAMVGLGNLLDTVKYIQLETLRNDLKNSYLNSPSRSETLKPLKNFTLVLEMPFGIETNIIFKKNTI